MTVPADEVVPETCPPRRSDMVTLAPETGAPVSELVTVTIVRWEAVVADWIAARTES